MTYEEMDQEMYENNYSVESKEKMKKILMDQLEKIQNTVKNQNRDIMTFSGFCKNIKELYDYVEFQAA